jgi:PAS domain S-box-containing protein
MALIGRHLKRAGYDLISERVETAETMKAMLGSGEWDVILCDYSMPQFSALRALALVKEMKLDIPFIIISGTIGEAAAVEAMRAGAQDYLMKDNLVRLGPTIDRERHESENRRARRQAEDAQRASELRYRRLFESAKDGILILDWDTGAIVDANPYLMKTLGYSYEELVGRELWEIGVFKDITAARDAFEELRDKNYVRYDDLPLETRAGVVIEVEFVSNVYAVGEAKVIQCNIRDITERSLGKRALEESNRKLEATLAELSATTQQLWQASKLATMGELSASIAHELNNPLATVALRVENLLLPMGPDDKERHSLEIITQEVDRMAALVNNLLQFSRRSHRQVSTADVPEEITKSIEFVNYHLRTHKIEVISDFAEPLPTIQADHLQLRQLFLNLLTNASDAMPHGGTLTMRATTGVLDAADAVEIDFADTGEGISAENLKKIWDPFFTTKMEGKGTGLGLAICRRIVEEHGGTIDLESEPGSGTTVHIVFPATMNGTALQQIS